MGTQYLIREYALPLRPEDYFGVMRSVIAELYETVELKPGVRELLARLKAEGARMCNADCPCGADTGGKRGKEGCL